MATSRAPVDAGPPQVNLTPAGGGRRAASAAGRTAPPLLAYVLHRYDWSESSLIVELYTRALGRVVVAAKGAKRPTSNFRPVLLPFQPLQVLLGRTPADERSEIHALRSAEWVGGAPLLPAAAMFPAYYLNELLLKMLAREDPHARLFDAYAAALVALAADADEVAMLRAFELTLLRELGWLPELGLVTVSAEPLRPEARYALQAESGLVTHAAGLPGAAWIALETALAQGGPAALRAACLPVEPALRAALRALLHYHLGSAALRTRQVWQGVQRLSDIR
ncbi:MAG: DNA repair protein RecO [Burkholderiales bacterium]|nr:DNA repair protein RecO [Burkholderiales bacterium]MDE1926356.1 DNA repair protein RecO [Burkholderiales bacterium]MDE2159214.1 DNA repair protein RecO [Burkholderiales bacterium]